MARTQLELVNDLQRRLRETVTASVSTSSYSQLLGMFVNDAKEFMEDKWFWTVNDGGIAVTVPADGTKDFSLTGTSDRTFILRRQDDRSPMVFDVTDDSSGQCQDIPYNDLIATRDIQGGDTAGNPRPDVEVPRVFALQRPAGVDELWISLLDGATNERTWRVYWYNPQARLAIDGTDDNTRLQLPDRPIFLLALYYALNERGEELGEPGNVAEQRAMDALAAAMEIDMQVHKVSDRITMTNVDHLRNKIVGDI